MIRPIQYLRGIAAMLVVYLHAVTRLPGIEGHPATSYFGRSGIDIFFVISGFIMVITTWEKPVSPLEFIKHRIVRIVPLYWLFTALIIALALSGHIYKETHVNLQSVLKSLFFIPYASPDFEGAPWPILLQGWTLNYEMFFYAMFAISLTLPRRLRISAMVGCLVALVITGYCLNIPERSEAGTYTSLLLIEFGLGMILGRLWLNGFRPNVPSSLIALLIGSYAIGATHPQLEISIGAGAIVLAALCPRFASIELKPLTELGNASYSIYLSHGIALNVLGYVWDKVAVDVTPVAKVVWMLIALVGCALGGWICHRLIERPVTKWLQGVGRPQRNWQGAELQAPRLQPAEGD